jgi:hypothetical protein
MKTSTKAGIAILAIFVLIIIGAGAFEIRVYQNNQHRSYCTNWSNSIDQRKADLNSTWFPSDSQYTELNTQVDQYNKECAF